MEKQEVLNVIILGSGCAGLTAGIYAGRAQLKPLIFEGNQPGGQLSLTSEIENFPGFENGVGSFELLQNMRKQAIRFGAKIVAGEVTKVEYDKTAKVKRITTSEGETYITKTLIIATGARARMLNLPHEEELVGKGVHTCATCDGFFFREKEVVVVGGGDSACEEALFLTRFASKVYLVHRRDKLRASKIMIKRVMENKKIEIIWNAVISKYVPDNEGILESIVLKNTQTNKEKPMKITGVFMGIGHIPNTNFLKGLVELDKEGYIIVKKSVETNIPGIFAGGDCADKVFRQAIAASGYGCHCSILAERWITENFE